MEIACIEEDLVSATSGECRPALSSFGSMMKVIRSGGDAEGGDVDVHRILRIASVAAGHGEGNGHTRGAARLQHQAVARGKPPFGHPQPPEAVVEEGICAREVDHELRPVLREDRWNVQLQRREEDLVPRAVGKLDVERAALLSEGKVLGAVDGEGEDRRVGGKDRRGAVALVHVAVEDRGADNPPLPLQGAHRDRRIVEDTEPLSLSGVRVVRAAGKIGSDPPPPARRRIQGGATGADRGARRAAGALDHLRAPGEADAPLLEERQRSHPDALQVIRVVRQRQLLPGGGGWLAQLLRRQDFLGAAALPQPRVLGHGEAVTGGERENETVGVERLHLSPAAVGVEEE
ncbi:MAG TPA: hypothetical protein VGR27_06160 [Longimicrobiaceae bacterium]|nr:hypothetical protein [Longimicrobiaceae bacterium]